MLFGKGHQLKVKKWLYQEGYFALRRTNAIVDPGGGCCPRCVSSSLSW